MPADKYPHVSEYVERMAGTALKLMIAGAAYRDDKCRVFFDISKFQSYGKLAGKKIRSQKIVMLEEYKPYQAGDFLLLSKCREKNCEKCANCNTVRSSAHDWSKDCKRCKVCSAIRMSTHECMDGSCAICGKSAESAET